MDKTSNISTLATIGIDRQTGKLIDKLCKRYSLKKGEIVRLAFIYIDKACINPSEAPESVKSELAKINKLFGTRIVNNAYPPTSSDFICEVASRIRYGFKYTDPPNETAPSNNTHDYSELVASTHALGGDSWQDRFTSIFGKNK